jgi:hypothetical protein
MTDREIPKDLVLTESQFREVIERATRAEAREPGITVEALRQVAVEAEIDEEKLESALRAVLEAKTPADLATPPSGRRSLGEILGDILPRHGRAVVFALIGGWLGWFSAHIGNTLNSGAMGFVDVPIGLGLIAISLANSVNRRVDGSVRRFIMESVATWAAFDIAWSITHGRVTDDILTYLLSCVVGASVWGWLFVRRSGRNDPPAAAAASNPPESRRQTGTDENSVWSSATVQPAT